MKRYTATRAGIEAARDHAQTAAQSQSSPPVAVMTAGAEHWLTVRELAEVLGVSESWIDKARRRDGLPSRRLGRARRYLLSEVVAWADRTWERA
ncbi:MAG: helix-turn-helix domain-containing protein [Gemmatimonadetes bacterium]|nr:helix-turn-helix domain-containing protein [Gemmatimonadota bacterium]